MGENVARVREVVARLLASRPAWPVPAEVAEARELLSPDRGPLADLELAEGRAASWEADARQMARNRDFYRDLVDEVAGQLGPEAYEADDGVAHEDPVRSKVPILVARLVAEVERERASAALRVGVEALVRAWRAAETADRTIGGVAGEVGATARADCLRGVEELLARVPERSADLVECHAHERDREEVVRLTREAALRDDLDLRERRGCGSIQPRTWREFRATGLFWYANRLLQAFGWAIVVEASDADSIVDAYPARVSFRGFDGETDDRGFRKLGAYLASHAALARDEGEYGKILAVPPEWEAPVGAEPPKGGAS